MPPYAIAVLIRSGVLRPGCGTHRSRGMPNIPAVCVAVLNDKTIIVSVLAVSTFSPGRASIPSRRILMQLAHCRSGKAFKSIAGTVEPDGVSGAVGDTAGVAAKYGVTANCGVGEFSGVSVASGVITTLIWLAVCSGVTLSPDWDALHEVSRVNRLTAA